MTAILWSLLLATSCLGSDVNSTNTTYHGTMFLHLANSSSTTEMHGSYAHLLLPRHVDYACTQSIGAHTFCNGNRSCVRSGDSADIVSVEWLDRSCENVFAWSGTGGEDLGNDTFAQEAISAVRWQRESECEHLRL